MLPASSYLQAGQSLLLAALVNGKTNQQVRWWLSPNVGNIMNGFYQAPAAFAGNNLQVTICATSLADPRKTATATVLLGKSATVSSPSPSNPSPASTISVSIGGGTTTLAAGHSAQFTASVAGTTNTGVTWSVSPNLGSVSNGLYTAPTSVSSQQTVVLTAVSVAAPTQSASVSLIVQPVPAPDLPAATVSISLSPGTTSLMGGQSATFSPLVTGTTNSAVTWTLSPQVGTINAGVYQAPTIISSEQTITVIATSVADTTKLASATVSLIPVGVTVRPSSAKLGVGGSATFTASVSGTTNTSVTWSLSPAVGTIAGGVYTAPNAIASTQTVTVTAASVTDSTKTATATVTLSASPVVLSLTPGSASLTGGQSATFTSTVTGTTNTAVTWSLSPAIGTITNGAYKAPSTIASQQTVTVTATSVADTTKSETATVTLVPVGVSVGPASASLGAGKSATFAASVTGTTNRAVTWTMNPAVGTLSNGIYTAPGTITAAQTVTLTAASVADPTKTATSTVTLTATVSNSGSGSNSNSGSSNGSSATTVTLPVEVIGANGTTTSATVNIPSGSNLNGQLSLWMQIHGLRFDGQASVQVNNSAWLPISTGNVTLAGNAAAYGGIGGGFSTLKMTMNLPANTVQTGSNTITFRFNQTDGRVSGFRVLAFNVQAADGTLLIPASTFVNDDPTTWQPPSTSASDISAGQTLWHSAALTVPILTGGSQPILAHCSDCHAQDGRDLKYFNYSNNSIQSRSQFHGLTAQQGSQIASYIRSLNVANPGRPWNPPYQPGPGLDEQPVIDWAAGAGLDAVLDTDQEMVNAMFPSGFLDSTFAATSRLNQRETPLPFQLPDWNQWLPGTHPMDAFGSAFTTSTYNTFYQTLSANLQAGNAASYVAQKTNFIDWGEGSFSFMQYVQGIWSNPAVWTPSQVDAIYSMAQWGMVKNWELNNQFQLEGLAQNIFGPQADIRAWYSSQSTDTSPHSLQMPSSGIAGLRNGTGAVYTYLSNIWYVLQLILNDSNGTQRDHSPIDWGYDNDFVMNMGELSSPQAGLQTLYMIKGLQISQEAGTGPQLGEEGWQPLNVNQIGFLTTGDWDRFVWTGVDPTTKAALMGGMLKAWLAQVNQFTPQQFYAGGWTTAAAVPVPGGNPIDEVFPDYVSYSIPRFQYYGVDPTLIGQYVQWAQTMWPSYNWSQLLSGTCSPYSIPGYLTCSQ